MFKITEITTLYKLAIRQNVPIRILFDEQGHLLKTITELHNRIRSSIDEHDIVNHFQSMLASVGLTAILPQILWIISKIYGHKFDVGRIVLYNDKKGAEHTGHISKISKNSEDDTIIHVTVSNASANFSLESPEIIEMNTEMKIDTKLRLKLDSIPRIINSSRKYVSKNLINKIGQLFQKNKVFENSKPSNDVILDHIIYDGGCLIILMLMGLFLKEVNMLRKMLFNKDRVSDYSSRSYTGSFTKIENVKPFHELFSSAKDKPNKHFYYNLVQIQESNRQNKYVRDIRPIHLFRPDGTPRKSLGEIEAALSKYVSFFTHRFIRKTFRRKNKKSLSSTAKRV